MFWRKISAKNKAVLITGCDSGFGNGLAYRLNSLGFKVYATVLDTESTGAQELATKCQSPDTMCVLQMDVTSNDQIDRCYQFVDNDLKTSGFTLWALVNNAGILTYGHIEWGRFDEFTKVFDVNVFGVIRVTRKFIPLIRPSKGRIVIVASMGGRLASNNLAAYCMSKSAIISFSDILRREMKKFSIRVTSIEPAFFKTGVYYSVIPAFERQWLESDDSVRQVYGNQYFADQMKGLNRRRRLARGSRDMSPVINDIVQAIQSRWPSRVYSPVNLCVLKVVPPLLPFIPQWLIDQGFYLMDNTKPAYMTDKTTLNNK